MATYVNDLRLKEIATGDEAGTWGASTNTNLELIAEAFSFGTEASFSSDADATTTIADGSTDPARSLYLKVTSGASLTATRTLTIAPNTVSKVWIIENATSGSQSINISQGSGANVTIANGDVKVVYSDGAGSGAAVVDAFTDLNLAGTTTADALTVTNNATVGGTLGVTGVVTANAGVVVDNITIDGTEIDSSSSLILDVAGNLTINVDGTTITLADDTINFGQFFNNSSGQFNISAPTQDKDIVFLGNDGGSTITALTLDMSNAGAATFNSSISTTGLGEFGALTVDDITLNGSSITDAGNLNITAGGDINLDADGGDIILKDGGTEFGRFSSTNNDLNIRTTTTDEDIVFKGSDGGSEITALTLDMSAAGDATFGGDVKLNFAKHLAIGTASPAASIDISGIAAGDQALLITSVRNDAISNGLARINITDSNAPFTGLQIDHAGTGSALEVNGKAVFNEGSADVDFRVESNGNANMLFVDGGNDRVGVGTGSPSKLLHLSETADGSKLRLTRGGVSEWDFSIGNTSTLSGVGSGALEILPANSGTANELAIGTAGSTTALVHVTNSGTTFSQAVTANAGVVVDNITIDGTEIDLSSGSLTLDVAATIILDADGGEILLKDGGTHFASFIQDSAGLLIRASEQDKDLFLQGNDGGSTITALSFDMSASGSATFNNSIIVGNKLFMADNKAISFGAGEDLTIKSDGTNAQIAATNDIFIDSAGQISLDADNAGSVKLLDGGTFYGQFFEAVNSFYIESKISDGDIIFRGNDGGSTITALTLDMSDAGAATFNSGGTFGGVLAVNSGTTNTVATFTSSDSGAGINLTDDSGTSNIQTNGANLRIGVDEDGAVSSSAIQLRVDGATKATLNDSGVFTCDGGVVVDNVTLDANKIATSSGNFTIDSASDIILDCDGANVFLKDDTTSFGKFNKNGNNLKISAEIQDGDIIFAGDDGGSAITALTLDMSNAGEATFGGNLVVEGADVTITANIKHAGDNDTFFGFHGNNLYRVTTGGTERFEVSDSGIIINDGSEDYDFRVESNSNTHMLFVDGGNDRIGINESSPDTPLHITTSSTGDLLTLESTGGGNGQGPNINLFRNSNSPAANDLGPALFFTGENSAGGQHTYANIYSQFTDVTDGAEDATVHHQISIAGTARSVLSLKSSEVTVNEESQNIDFRVESDNKTHMLFVDGGNDVVTFGTSTATLFSNNSDVYGASIDADGLLQISRNNGAMLYLNRQNANGEMIDLRVNGGQIGSIGSSSESLFIKSAFQDRDIIFKGNDGGSEITALTLDMSAAGEATFNDDINLGDNKRLRMGAGGDFEIFHDGSNNYIKGATGDQDLIFQGVDGSSTITALTLDMSDAGAASFNAGGTFGGAVTINTTASGDGIRVVSTNADAASGPNITLMRDSSSPADNDGLASIIFSGDDSAGNETSYASINTTVLDVTDGTEDSRMSFMVRSEAAARSGIILDGTSGATFNEDGIAAGDFRVESNGNTHMLFVDSNVNRIGVGATPLTNGSTFQVTADATESDNVQLTLRGATDINKQMIMGFDTTANTAHITTQIAGSAPTDLIFKTGDVVFNENSVDADFRVESDSNTHALFVDAGNSYVGINRTPAVELDIQRVTNATPLRVGSSGGEGRGIAFADIQGSPTKYNFFAGAQNNFDNSFEITPSTAVGGYTFSNPALVVNATTGVIINENSADFDFRVESDNDTHALFVDAGNDRVIVGSTAATTGTDFVSFDAAPGTSGQLIQCGRDDASTKNHVIFTNPNGTVGSIQTAGSATAYNTSSDARLKENIADADEAGELIDAIQVRKFDWKADGEHQRYGMVAQELQTVAPEAVSEGETEEDMMGVDYSKLVPMLVKEIQTLRARVADLES